MWDFVMDKSGAGAGFLRELRFTLPIYIPSASLIIFTITRGWHNRPGVAAVPIAWQTKKKTLHYQRALSFWNRITNTLEESTAFIFRAEEQTKHATIRIMHLLLFDPKHEGSKYVPSKCQWTSTRQHVITFHKMVHFAVTAVRTLNEHRSISLKQMCCNSANVKSCWPSIAFFFQYQYHYIWINICHQPHHTGGFRIPCKGLNRCLLNNLQLFTFPINYMLLTAL
jgi:hypothetical protein